MKRLLALGISALIALTACQQPQTVIKGTLENTESDTLLIQAFPNLSRQNPETFIFDTITMRNGTFVYEIKNDTVPMEVFFSVKPRGEEQLSLRKTIGVVAFPGEHVQVNGTFDDYQIKGSRFQEALAPVQTAYKAYEDSLHAITQEVMALQKANKLTPEKMQAMHQLYLTQEKAMNTIKTEYVRKHPEAFISVYFLYKMSPNKELLELIREQAEQGPLAPIYREMCERANRANILKENQKKIVEGAVAPDFTLKDVQGKEIALSSLRGKTVVLDFWGSWCGWCMKGMPKMKTYYTKYKDKIEILGVDCGDREEVWKSTVAEHEMTWLQVRNTAEAKVDLLYAVRGYPTKIVVSPEGKIAKIFVGEAPAFYEYLDELGK